MGEGGTGWLSEKVANGILFAIFARFFFHGVDWLWLSGKYGACTCTRCVHGQAGG